MSQRWPGCNKEFFASLIEKGALVVETGSSAGSDRLAPMIARARVPMLHIGNFTELQFTNTSQWVFAGEPGGGPYFKGGGNYED